jgi:hypothetical protein
MASKKEDILLDKLVSTNWDKTEWEWGLPAWRLSAAEEK